MAYSINNKAKLEQLQPEIKTLSKDLAEEVAVAQRLYEWDSNIAKTQYRVNVSNCNI